MAVISQNTNYKSITLPQMDDIDASKSNDFEFSSSGLNLAERRIKFIPQGTVGVSKTLTATDNISKFTIPENYLVNEAIYNCYIEIKDGSTWAKSDIKQFYCYQEPVITVMNPTANSGSYTVKSNYEQDNAKQLYEYEVNVINTATGQTVASTGKCFGYNITKDISKTINGEEKNVSVADFEQVIQNLEDGVTYKYEITCRSRNKYGIKKTGSVQFTASIPRIIPSTSIELEQNKSKGAVTVSANITKITGELYPNSADVTDYFIQNGESDYKINLKEDASYVSFNENFHLIDSSYELVIYGNYFKDFSTICYVGVRDANNSLTSNPESALSSFGKIMWKKVVKDVSDFGGLSYTINYKAENDPRISDIVITSTDFSGDDETTDEYYAELTINDGTMTHRVVSNIVTNIINSTNVRILVRYDKTNGCYGINIEK